MNKKYEVVFKSCAGVILVKKVKHLCEKAMLFEPSNVIWAFKCYLPRWQQWMKKGWESEGVKRCEQEKVCQSFCGCIYMDIV